MSRCRQLAADALQLGAAAVLVTVGAVLLYVSGKYALENGAPGFWATPAMIAMYIGASVLALTYAGWHINRSCLRRRQSQQLLSSRSGSPTGLHSISQIEEGHPGQSTSSAQRNPDHGYHDPDDDTHDFDDDDDTGDLSGNDDIHYDGGQLTYSLSPLPEPSPVALHAEMVAEGRWFAAGSPGHAGLATPTSPMLMV